MFQTASLFVLLVVIGAAVAESIISSRAGFGVWVILGIAMFTGPIMVGVLFRKQTFVLAIGFNTSLAVWFGWSVATLSAGEEGLKLSDAAPMVATMVIWAGLCTPLSIVARDIKSRIAARRRNDDAP